MPVRSRFGSTLGAAAVTLLPSLLVPVSVVALALGTRPIRPRATWMIALAAAILLGGLHAVVHHQPQRLLQLLAGAAVAVGISAVPWGQRRIHDAVVVRGLVLGLLVLALWSAVELALPGAASGRARGWLAHPNLWGVTGLVAATTVLTIKGPSRAGLLAVLAVATTITASGSRSAALALATALLVTMAPAVERALATRGPHRRGALAAVLALGVAVALAYHLRPAILVRFLPGPPPCCNRLIASEDLTDPAWAKVQVRVEAAPGNWWRPRKTHRVVKVGDAWWARAQQGVGLEPGQGYWFSFELASPSPDAQPGLHGISGNGPYALVSILRTSQGWVWESEGAVELLAVKVTPLPGPWERVEAEMRYMGADAARFQLGPTPHQAVGGAGTELWVRAPSWAHLDAPRRYAPTFGGGADARGTVGTLDGRLAYARAAWIGFVDRPWSGWGAGTFSARLPGIAPELGHAANHPHNTFLRAAFEGGSVGLLGLIAFIGAITALGGRRALPLLLVLLAANSIDDVFYSEHVFYTWIAACAWLSPRRRSFPGDLT